MIRKMSDEEVSQRLAGHDSAGVGHLGLAVEILRSHGTDFEAIKAILEAVYSNHIQENPGPFTSVTLRPDGLIAIVLDPWGAYALEMAVLRDQVATKTNTDETEAAYEIATLIGKEIDKSYVQTQTEDK